MSLFRRWRNIAGVVDRWVSPISMMRAMNTEEIAEPEIVELGNPVLQTPAAPVVDFEDPQLQRYLATMSRLMHERQGVGIAAPQIGVGLQIMIVASRPNPRYPDAPTMEPAVLLNPVIQWQSPDQVKDWEGCLSVPGIRGLVERPKAVRVAYSDREGRSRSVAWDGFPARIFLHEYDHFIGKTFIDRVSSSHDLYTEKEYLRLLERKVVTG